MGLTISINSSALEKLVKSVEQNNKSFLPLLQNDVKSVAVEATRMVKTLTPIKTGTTNRQWYMKLLAPLVIMIFNDSKIARYLEEGTGLYGEKKAKYPIKPKNKKALSFAWGKGFEMRTGASASDLKFRKTGSLTEGSLKKYGNSAFTTVKSVMHPGIRALHMARNTASYAQSLLKNIVEKRAKEWKLNI